MNIFLISNFNNWLHILVLSSVELEYFNSIFSLILKLWILCILLSFIPQVKAASSEDPFPNISFKLFSEFINLNFSSNITLATVLTSKNPGLDDEYSASTNGWIKALAIAIQTHLNAKINSDLEDTQLFNSSENPSILGSTKISKYKILEPLKPISMNEIEPVLLICPARITCSTLKKECTGRALHINTHERDRTQVTLIKGIKSYENAQIVSGYCTKYHKSLTFGSDLEDSQRNPNVSSKDRLTFNKAKYLKIGQNIWADRLFTNMVVNSVYHFHASTAAYTEFWNYTFSNGEENDHPPISRLQVWKAFIHETTRQISVSMNKTLQITTEAYKVLGQNGIIGNALHHSCNECTHNYKATADYITADDNAAVAGIDENWTVPLLRQDADNTELENIIDNEMEIDYSLESKVKMEPDNYFTAPRFYCVETICAPCGVVIAWTKFVKSEGAAQIMDFLEDVYPTQESRPSYVCIDKACVVLKYLINSHNWNIWKTSTRFVVDSYHYINHRVTDYLCRIYCNPSPLNGSAPNLVVVERDVHGNQHYKRAFNTQACEQLNAWLGGFQSILNRMTSQQHLPAFIAYALHSKKPVQ
ncbi:hypothetical protein BDQ17DRAFT_1392922 [Cyathus striatus]|nr:hypothetical protein BDQ17DRAFT_1392922 [Cyathus striatus]